MTEPEFLAQYGSLVDRLREQRDPRSGAALAALTSADGGARRGNMARSRLVNTINAFVTALSFRSGMWEARDRH